MSNETPSSLLPPELLDELFKHTPTDPEGMAAFISMVTNTFAAQIAGHIATQRATTKDRAELIHQQMGDRLTAVNNGGSYEDIRMEWIEDLSAYTHLEALSLLGRAANRQMKVYEGTHKPFSASRGKGFGKGAN